MSDIDYSAQIALANPTDAPLIYTSKGNIPEGALTYKTEWFADATHMVFREEWHLGEELVKANSHTYTNNPFQPLGIEQSTF
jgi:hypothetical protein